MGQYNSRTTFVDYSGRHSVSRFFRNERNGQLSMKEVQQQQEHAMMMMVLNQSSVGVGPGGQGYALYANCPSYCEANRKLSPMDRSRCSLKRRAQLLFGETYIPMGTPEQMLMNSIPPESKMHFRLASDEVESLKKLFKENMGTDYCISVENLFQLIDFEEAQDTWLAQRLHQTLCNPVMHLSGESACLQFQRVGRINYHQLLAVVALLWRGTKEELTEMMFCFFDVDDDDRISTRDFWTTCQGIVILCCGNNNSASCFLQQGAGTATLECHLDKLGQLIGDRDLNFDHDFMNNSQDALQQLILNYTNAAFSCADQDGDSYLSYAEWCAWANSHVLFQSIHLLKRESKDNFKQGNWYLRDGKIVI